MCAVKGQMTASRVPSMYIELDGARQDDKGHLSDFCCLTGFRVCQEDTGKKKGQRGSFLNLLCDLWTAKSVALLYLCGNSFNRHTKGNAFSNLIYIFFLLILASKCSDIGFVNIAGGGGKTVYFFIYCQIWWNDEMSENAID